MMYNNTNRIKKDVSARVILFLDTVNKFIKTDRKLDSRPEHIFDGVPYISYKPENLITYINPDNAASISALKDR